MKKGDAVGNACIRCDAAPDWCRPLTREGRSPSSPPARLPASPSRTRAAHLNLAQAREAIERVFGEGRNDIKAREVKDLVRELERLLGERPSWTLDTTCSLFDGVAAGRNNRKRSLSGSTTC